jgi:hypothetical protein
MFTVHLPGQSVTENMNTTTAEKFSDQGLLWRNENSSIVYHLLLIWPIVSFSSQNSGLPKEKLKILLKRNCQNWEKIFTFNWS